MDRTTRCALLILTALLIARPVAILVADTPAAGRFSLSSGHATVEWAGSGSAAPELDVSLTTGAGTIQTFRTTQPLSLELLDVAGPTHWLSGGYSAIVRAGASLRCRGEIRSPSGSVFRFSDTYQPGPVENSFELAREVIVPAAAGNDAGFLSRFSLRAAAPSPLREHEVFIPGIWYRDNRQVPPRALAGNLSDEHFLIREDRLPLPLVMMRNPHDGVTITLIHAEPDGSSCLADYGAGRAIDGRIQVASMGVESPDNPAVVFCFPAIEGERSYFRGQGGGRGGQQGKRWVERFHPVGAGVRHAYKLLITLTEQADFPHAMRHAWRTAYAAIHHPPAQADIPACYEASIKLIADWSQTRNGCPGLPFRLRLPKGELGANTDINFQMGFVGQQLPLACHLLRYGLVKQDAQIVRKGEAMVDFWAASSLTADGLPRTWFDVYPQPHWRRYDTFLRIASDGMTGALMAWDVMQKHGRPKPGWLRFCRRFGDWLVQHQNADGSWFRQYDSSGKAVNEGKLNSTHPVRFLVDLAAATHERQYLDSALRAGEFCWTNVHRAFAYVGGTPDNPNVIDKEAGFLALEAFLALHDATGQQRWLDAAAQAADFTETWQYSWNIPVPADDRASIFPKGATTTGFSLIATGQSGADLFLAGAPFFYYRLYLAECDTHYGDMAWQFLHATKQSLDIGGSLGYGHSGLCTEALRIASPRGEGANVWLPWLTFSMIEPIVRLQETYGMMDTPLVEGARLEELRAKDRAFAASRALFAVKVRIGAAVVLPPRFREMAMP